MLVHFDKPVSPSDIKAALEGHDIFAKIQSMQTAIKMLLSGEQLPAFFITVVRYVLPSEDHTIQKLLLLYLVSLLQVGLHHNCNCCAWKSNSRAWTLSVQEV